MVTLCSWKNSHRSDILVVMHHQLSGLTTYGVKAYGRDRVDQPAYASLSLNVIQLAD